MSNLHSKCFIDAMVLVKRDYGDKSYFIESTTHKTALHMGRILGSNRARITSNMVRNIKKRASNLDELQYIKLEGKYVIYHKPKQKKVSGTPMSNGKKLLIGAIGLLAVFG